VIIMNRVYRDEMAASLSEMRLSPQLFAI
jgi:hypothetical protein